MQIEDIKFENITENTFSLLEVIRENTQRIRILYKFMLFYLLGGFQ